MRMSTLQIRNVPEDVRRTLKTRAAQSGQSLSEYALAQLRRSADVPTLEELSERILARGAVDPSPAAAKVLRAERKRR